jgi:colicin import membrane protein
MLPGRRNNHDRSAAVREHAIGGMTTESRLVSIAFAVSAVFHILFLSTLVFTQTHDFRRRQTASFISVDLVSLPQMSPPAQQTPPPAQQSPPKAPAPAETPPVKKTVSTRPKEPDADVSLAPKKKISLKKKTFKTEKVKKRALEKIEKKVETTSTERIAAAIDNIKSRVAEEDARTPPQTRADAGAQTARVAGDGEDSGGRRAELIDIYRTEIAFQIEKNWAFSDQLAGGQTDLLASLVFKVMPDGEIRDVFFMERSGNKYLDDSAYRAVMKSNPVLPHPKGIAKPFVEIGINFTPKGLR